MKITRSHTVLLSMLLLGAMETARAEEGQPAPAADSGSTASSAGGAPAPASDGTTPAVGGAGADASAPPAGSTTAAPQPTGGDAAREALKQKEGDATSAKNLEEVFKATEKTYSLLKSGKVGLQYGVDYSYYRDSRIDIAISENSSTLTRFRIEEDAQHTFTNTFDVTYGVLDNLTLSASLPLVTKFDTQSSLKATGLGDISLGLRWQPVPIKRGLPSATLFASLSTATGDSPFDINVSNDLATGKGYYSLSLGGSMSKVADPIVLFASGSYSLSTQVSDINQLRGGRILTGVEPGASLGGSMGLAYSLNYDVSITASYQQSYSFSSTYTFAGGEYVSTAASTSASVNFSLGLRTNPKRIINVSLGYGLTEDAPDVSIGVSMPIDFLGSGDE